MTASIVLSPSPQLQSLLRLGDTCLIWQHRLSEWCGHAPVLEEDMALANIALDLLGQARALLAHAGALCEPRLDEDQLAYLRDERQFFNVVMAELPNTGADPSGRRDFAHTVVRNHWLACWAVQQWQALAHSADAQLAAIAGKALKEARYHREHSGDWVVRLGDGTQASHRRMAAAVQALAPYIAELFDDDAADRDSAAQGRGPLWSSLQQAWLTDVSATLTDAGLGLPPPSAFVSHGKRGVHSEHLGPLLAQMQSLQRSFPGGAW
jgi:ring-1,2-phenylacetyl-CoA epoxidase subunit PaaC